MQFASEKEIAKRDLFNKSIFSEDVERLEKENELLDKKIEELIEAEQQLLFRIVSAINFKRQINAEKKEQIKILEQKCGQLTELLKTIS